MADEGGIKIVCENRKAFHNYYIEDKWEAGLVLTGTEVKSLRAQSPNLRDAFVEVQSRGSKMEAWLLNAHIGPYSHGNIWNHEAVRKRKLLLHRRQIEQIYGAITQKGLSVIPIRMYFKKGRAKVELGLGKGKKKYDKRETLKKKSAQHEMDVALKYKG